MIHGRECRCFTCYFDHLRRGSSPVIGVGFCVVAGCLLTMYYLRKREFDGTQQGTDTVRQSLSWWSPTSSRVCRLYCDNPYSIPVSPLLRTCLYGATKHHGTGFGIEPDAGVVRIVTAGLYQIHYSIDMSGDPPPIRISVLVNNKNVHSKMYHVQSRITLESDFQYDLARGDKLQIGYDFPLSEQSKRHVVSHQECANVESWRFFIQLK